MDRIIRTVSIALIQLPFIVAEADCTSMIVGGEIIANKNRELKSLVLYPRGVPFLTTLSGTVTATLGQQLVGE